MEMDMKVIEQLVAQALKEMKAEEPAAFAQKKEETYGVFTTMDEAVEASIKAQKTLLFSKIEERQKYVDIIRATVLKRENLELISRMAQSFQHMHLTEKDSQQQYQRWHLVTSLV